MSDEDKKYSDIGDRHVLIHNRIHYDIKVGNIADSQDETVVNSTGSQIYLGAPLAKAIVAKAGQDLAKALAAIGSLAEGEVVATGNYNMKCKQLLHCNVADWEAKTQDDAKLKGIVVQCLEMAAKKGHKTIAIPAIGMGIKGYPLDVVAYGLVNGVAMYAKNNPKSSLTNVRLYLYTGDATKDLIERFCEPFKLIGHGKTENGLKLENDVVLEIFKGDLADTKADIIVNSTASHMSMSSGNVSLALLNKAGQALQEECAKCGALGSGEIVMTDGFGLQCAKVLHVNCPEWDSGDGVKILGGLITKCLDWMKDNKASTIAFPVIGTGILKYPPTSVARCFLRAASTFAKTNPKSSVRRIMLVAYSKDETTIKGIENALGLTLKNQTKKKEEDVKKLINDGKMVIDLPVYWEKPVSEYRDFEVSECTTEFKDVSGSFMKTIGRPADQVAIIQVKRIQNPKTYSLYVAMKNNVAMALSKPPDEVETAPLWHSTNHSNIPKITRHNFDRGLSGTVGGNLLGAGCYFSVTSEYSDRNFSRANADGEKFMIMARVVTGDYCKGHGQLKQAPYKSEFEQYDSVVDNEANPTMYAVFNDSSVYPEYIIKYKFVKSKSTATPRPSAATPRPSAATPRPSAATRKPSTSSRRTSTSSSSSNDSCLIL